MPNNEQLREVLIELQVLRERELQEHSETTALLGAIERFATADSAAAAMRTLIDAIADETGGRWVLVLERGEDGTPEVLQATDPALEGAGLALPLDPFARTRNIADAGAIAPGGVSVGAETALSVLCAQVPGGPDAPDRAVACLSPRKGAFSRSDLRLLGRLAGLVGRAITAARLESENALLAAAIEGSSAGFAISDTTRPDRPLVYVNPAFEEITGYSAEEVIGINCRFLSDEPPDHPERTRLRDAVARCDSGRFLLRNRRKDGTRFWNDLTLFPVRDAEDRPRHLVATQTDVTAKVEAEIESARIRQRMEQAFAVTTDAYLAVGGDGRIVFANDAMRAAFPAPGAGWRVGTGYAENLAAYMGGDRAPGAQDGDLPDLGTLLALAAAEAAREISRSDGRSFLLRARCDQDGTLVLTITDITRLKTVETLLRQRVSAMEAAVDGIAIISADDRIQYLNRSAAALLGFDDPAGVLGRKWFQFYEDAERDLVGTETLRRRDTGTGTGTEGGARTHEITRARIEDSSHVLIIRDISDRIAEKERQDHLRDALARAQRQEAVAQLASGIAHDFNNLLSAISGSATLIDVGPDASPAAREHARRIVQASNRAGRLVNRLLDLGATPRDRSSFELRTALADLPEMVAHALPRGVSLETDMGEESMVLHGDPDALGQICLNLILNATDALPIGGGRVSLSATSVQPAHARELRIGTLSAGRRYACIAVADTGSGIDGEALTRIFEPDYSTKGPRGTGLGLTMSALLTRAAGGGIDVESVPGRGSTFSVYWPIITGAADRTDGPQPAVADADLSGQTYLVVDDDLEVGQVLQSYLERCGAEVALSDAPDIAADAIAEDTGMWSALITDYDMPGMTGGDLVERVRAHAPDLPVILVTALARRITDPRVRPDRIDAIFPKPLDLAALAGKLAEIARRRQKDSP